jgi:2-oxoglutarate ferredoxin oxidoreductase subunit beta
VIVIGGDGDVYGEGMHHFMQALRKNINITLLVHDNQIYGLTKGQASPTTMYGEKTSSTPNGYDEQPINPMAIAISQNAPFVARGFAGNLPHLTDLIAEAIDFKGFSFVDIFQPCVTFNKHNTFEWFKERVYDLAKTPYKPDNQAKAFKKALEFGDKIPLGVILKTQGRKLFEEVHATLNQPAPLVKHKMQKVDIRDLMEKLCV